MARPNKDIFELNEVAEEYLTYLRGLLRNLVAKALADPNNQTAKYPRYEDANIIPLILPEEVDEDDYRWPERVFYTLSTADELTKNIMISGGHLVFTYVKNVQAIDKATLQPKLDANGSVIMESSSIEQYPFPLIRPDIPGARKSNDSFRNGFNLSFLKQTNRENLQHDLTQSGIAYLCLHPEYGNKARNIIERMDAVARAKISLAGKESLDDAGIRKQFARTIAVCSKEPTWFERKFIDKMTDILSLGIKPLVRFFSESESRNKAKRFIEDASQSLEQAPKRLRS